MAEAASVQISRKHFIEITECSICQESFKHPKVLPCIHTFCLHCLEKYGEDYDPGDKANCPLCRNVFTVPQEGFKNLPNNYFILQLMQVSQSPSTESTGKHAMPCELCAELDEKPPAVAYCIDCGQNICQSCSTRHKKQKGTPSHQVVDLKDKPSAEEPIREPSYCEKHPTREIEFYCYDCKIIVCVLCYVDHKLSQHKCCEVKESAVKFRKQLKNDCEIVTSCISRNQDEITRLEDIQKLLKNKVESTKAEISWKYDQVRSLLDSHQNALIAELDSFEEKRLKELEIRRDDVERQVVSLQSYKRYCQEMDDKGTLCEISRAGHDLHLRAEDLVKTQHKLATFKLSAVYIKFTPSHTATINVENWIGQLELKVEARSNMKAEAENLSVSTSFLDPSSSAVDIISVEARSNMKAEAENLFVSTSFLDPSCSVVDIISGNSWVYGVAIVSRQLFVARPHVEVYDLKNFTSAPYRQLKISDSNLKNVRLAGCSHYNCLYIKVDRDLQSVIHRVDVSDCLITEWKAKEICCRLSITNNYNLLVTINNPGRIQEYTTHGKLIREIRLDRSLDDPQHCVQLSNGNFVICHRGLTQQRVCVLDHKGRIKKSFGGLSGSGVDQLNAPYHLSVDSNDNVFVADYYNNRVQLLNPTLTLLGTVQTPGHELRNPYVIYLDEISRHLYIGEDSGRLLVLSKLPG